MIYYAGKAFKLLKKKTLLIRNITTQVCWITGQKTDYVIIPNFSLFETALRGFNRK